MTVKLTAVPSEPWVTYKWPRVVRWLAGILVVVAVLVAALLLAFWRGHIHHGFGKTLAQIFPVPAAAVDGKIVWYGEVVKNATALEDDAGLGSDEAIKRGLLLAERYAVTREIGSTLGVVKDNDRLAYDTAVEAALLQSDKYQGEARQRVERLAAKLTQGIQFKDLATQYSEGASASVGGDLGYVDPATLPPDLNSVVATMTAGMISSVVETRTSFWLVDCEDVIANDDGTKKVWLKVIEIKKDLLGPIVDRALAAADIKEFVR